MVLQFSLYKYIYGVWQSRYVIILVIFINLCTTEINGNNFFLYVIGDCEDYHDARNRKMCMGIVITVQITLTGKLVDELFANKL